MLDVPATADPLARATWAQLLGELGRAATTVELAERLDLHPDGVRVRLARLERDGLVVRTTEPRTIAPGARPGGQSPRAYHDVARRLIRAIPSDRPSLRAIETTGRKLAATDAPTRTDGLVNSLAVLGFLPTLTVDIGATAPGCLPNRSDRHAVRENQAAICTLHRGVTGGLLDMLDPGARLVSFEPDNPTDARCLIEPAGTANAAVA